MGGIFEMSNEEFLDQLRSYATVPIKLPPANTALDISWPNTEEMGTPYPVSGFHVFSDRHIDNLYLEAAELRKRFMAHTCGASQEPNLNKQRLQDFRQYAAILFRLLQEMDPTNKRQSLPLQENWDFARLVMERVIRAENAYADPLDFKAHDSMFYCRFEAVMERTMDWPTIIKDDTPRPDGTVVNELTTCFRDFKQWMGPQLPRRSMITETSEERAERKAIAHPCVYNIVMAKNVMTPPITTKALEQAILSLLSPGGLPWASGNPAPREFSEVETRTQVLLQHYAALYHLLRTWNDADESRKYGFTDANINLSNRACQTVQKAAWYVIRDTEKLWKELLRLISTKLIPKPSPANVTPFQTWLISMVIVAVSVQVDGWKAWEEAQEA